MQPSGSAATALGFIGVPAIAVSSSSGLPCTSSNATTRGRSPGPPERLEVLQHSRLGQQATPRSPARRGVFADERGWMPAARNEEGNHVS